MKDWNFIERLNLYLDGELSGEQVGELEAELRSSPEKMRLYRSYLRLDRGTGALAKALEAEAVQPRVRGDVIWVPKTVRPRARPAGAGIWRFALAGTSLAVCAVAVLFPWKTGPSQGSLVASQEAERVPTNSGRLASAPIGLLAEPVGFRAATRSVGTMPSAESWAQFASLEAPSELPELTTALPTPPRAHPSFPVRTLALPSATLPAYHNSRTHNPAVAASFTSYEFSR